MSVLCFSFDCDFTDDGTSNCFTSDTKYSQTTTHKPTTTTPTPHPTTLPSGTGKVTTGAIYTTTANISTPVNPWQHKVTSHPPAGGVAIYIPCSVAGCVLLIVLLFCIGFVRRRRYRRLSSEDRQLLQPDHDDTIISEVHLDTEYQHGSEVPGPNIYIADDTEEELDDIDMNRIGIEDSDDFDGMAPFRRSNGTSDESTPLKQKQRTAKIDKVV